MKKLLSALAILFVVASMASANKVTWFVPWGVYDPDATDLTADDGGILENYDVLWQLIYAGENKAIDPIDVDNSAKGFVSGDDEVLGSRLLSHGASGIFDDMLYTENDMDTAINLDYSYSDDNPYFVYQRVYDAQVPVAGQTKYYESRLVQLTEAEYGDGLQSFPLSTDWNAGVKPELTVQGSNVPEPATMSLLGLGALAMALRRKLRK